MLPGPLPSTPARRAGSVRRTSHVRFTNRPFDGGLPTVFGATGRARDLLTFDDGAVVLATAAIDVVTDDTNVIEAVVTEPHEHGLDALLSHRVGFGFGSAARHVLRPLAGSLVGRLLSDLDGGWAPAAWGASRESMRLAPVPEPGGVHQGTAPDTCAGWRAEGTPMRLRLAGERPPFADDPERAPELAGDDPLAWHELEPLTVGQARRLRRLDVARADGGLIEIDAHFRDSAVIPDRTERVVHEYTVTAAVETDGWTFTRAEAEPRVLPFPNDCALAADSASLLIGRTVESLRAGIGPDGRGPGACTHLTELLRTLADVDQLAPLIDYEGNSMR